MGRFWCWRAGVRQDEGADTAYRHLIDGPKIAVEHLGGHLYQQGGARDAQCVEMIFEQKFGPSLPGQPPRLGGLAIGTFHSISRACCGNRGHRLCAQLGNLRLGGSACAVAAARAKPDEKRPARRRSGAHQQAEE